METLITPSFDYEHAISTRRQVVFFGKQTIDMVEFDEGFDQTELEAFNESFRYGIYKLDNIPYVLLEFGALDFQFYINAFEVVQASKGRWIKDFKGDASLTIVHASSRQTLAKVVIVFDQDFLVHLKSCLRTQLHVYKSEYQVTARAVQQINFLVPEKMKKRGRMYRHIKPL